MSFGLTPMATQLYRLRQDLCCHSAAADMALLYGNFIHMVQTVHSNLIK
jgi:hypothetical protein